MTLEELNLESMLIEGFDAKKMPKEEVDKDWRKIVAAKQNDTILQAEMGGLEKIGEKDCEVVNIGRVRGYIPMEYTGVENLRQLRALTGKKIVFKVLEYIEEPDKKIFMASRTAAIDENGRNHITKN